MFFSNQDLFKKNESGAPPIHYNSIINPTATN